LTVLKVGLKSESVYIVRQKTTMKCYVLNQKYVALIADWD